MATEGKGTDMMVRIAQLPGGVKSLSLDGSVSWTVAKVLAEAQMSPQGFEIRVNGNPATLNTPVEADQTILLVRPVRGNTAAVRVAQLPGGVKTLPIDEATEITVGQLLSDAEINAEGFEIRVNGNPATLNTPVTADQTILLVRPVRGN